MANAIRALSGTAPGLLPRHAWPLSAHSNGFQEPPAPLHMLQVLIGAVDCSGGFRFRAALPKTACRPSAPHYGRAEHFGSNQPLSGPHLGFPLGPEDLLIDEEGRPARLRQGLFLGGADCRPWADAHGNRQRPCRRSVSDRPLLFLYMANMAWNSSMNTAGTIAMLEARDEVTGGIPHPEDHRRRCLCLRDGRLCRSGAARHEPIWSATTASRCSTGRYRSRIR